MARTARLLCALFTAIAIGCTSDRPTPLASSAYVCSATPFSVKVGSDGTNLTGVRGGDIFLYTARPGPFHASPPEKFIVLLANLPANPRAVSLDVHGRNLTTGANVEVRAKDLTASFGEGWGAIYSFPDAGCWELAIDQEGNRGSVVIEVVATCSDERRSSCPDPIPSP